MRNRTAHVSEIQGEIQAFVQAVLSHGIDVEQVILFGSFAKGGAHRYSDIDLAVVSSQFGRDEIAEMMALSRWSLPVSNRIEAVAISKEMLGQSDYALITEIEKWGKIVYDKPTSRSV